MKINKQSNWYTILYIVVLVVVVGTALAYTAMSLKDKQQENIANDKMRQILASLHVTAPKDSIAAEFSRYVTRQFIVDSNGTEIEGDAFDVNVAAQSKLPDEQRQLPVYEISMPDGSHKYILPVYGAGLWGPIWGYVALDSDGSTIYGAYFDHQGETPGLGAEIAKPAFSDQFVGKHLFTGYYLIPVAVVKKGQKYNGSEYVDGVSGGTITSKGVSAMLQNCLRPYENFLRTLNNTEEK